MLEETVSALLRAMYRLLIGAGRACGQPARARSVHLALALACMARSALAGIVDVDAKMAQFEADASPEAVQLARSPLAPAGLLQQLMPTERFAAITDPDTVGSSGSPVGRRRVSCRYVAARRPVVIVIAGQSNASNTADLDSGNRAFATDKPIFNLNLADGRCYRAENPLLGSDGELQGFALPLAAQLIEARIFRRVLLVPTALAGTGMEEWAPPRGHHWKRLATSVRLLDRMGLRPHLFLWHHGEGNAGFLTAGPNDIKTARTVGTNASEITRDAVRLSYIRSFLAMVDGLRALGLSAPILPAVATLCGTSTVSPDIRSAQLSLPDPGWNIFAGPDTDELDLSLRSPQDSCHFSDAGNRLHARKWFDVIHSHLAVNPLQHSWMPKVHIKADRQNALAIERGRSYTLSFSSSGASSCTLTHLGGNGRSSREVSHNRTRALRSSDIGTYTLSCRSAAGLEQSASVTVTAAPGGQDASATAEPPRPAGGRLAE